MTEYEVRVDNIMRCILNHYRAPGPRHLGGWYILMPWPEAVRRAMQMATLRGYGQDAILSEGIRRAREECDAAGT